MFENDEDEVSTVLTFSNENIMHFDEPVDELFDKNPVKLKLRLFSCSGAVSVNDKTLNSNSFLQTNELDYVKIILNNTSINSYDDLIDSVLFARNYSSGSVLLNDMERLFNISSQNLKALLSISISQSNTFEFIENRNYFLIRKQIIEFVYYLRHFLCRSWKSESYYWIMKSVVPKLETGMKRLLVQNIMSLPNFILDHSGSKTGNESKNPSYHLFHCYLELKWLLLTLKCDINCYKETIEGTQLITDEMDECKPTNTTCENEIKNLLSDLLKLGVYLFNKLETHNLLIATPFNCLCVKELWIMLQLFIEYLTSQGKCRPFWELYNESLYKMRSAIDNFQSKNDVEAQHFYNCNNPQVFTIWMTYHIALLQGYDNKGIFLGRENNLRIVSNYEPIVSNLTQWINSVEFQQNEPKNVEIYLRSVLPILIHLIVNWWEPKSEPITVLWEFFHRRLNSLFYLPSDTPESLAVICKTSSALISQIKSRIENPNPNVLKLETSYHLFLKLIGLFFKKTFETNFNQYQKLKGRIYLKFSSNKLNSLNQMGLYNAISLFLTIAVTTDLQEAGTKLQTLLMGLSSLDRSSNKMQYVLCTHLALIKLFIENKFDIKDVTNPLLILLKQIEPEWNSPSSLLKHIVIDGIQEIFESSQEFNFGEYVLIDSWISRVLQITSTSVNYNPIYEVLITITKKLHILYGQDTNLLTEKEFPKLTQNIFQHVLPVLKQNISTQTNFNLQLPELISEIIILSLDDPQTANRNSGNFINLISSFIVAPNVPLRLIQKILAKILKEQKVLEEFSKCFVNYQIIIIQLWIQCNLVCVKNYDQDLVDILNVIIKLPDIRAQFPEFSSLVESSDRILNFFEIISKKHDTKIDEEKNKVSDFLTLILKGLDDRINLILKSKAPDEKILINTYAVVGKLFYHCSNMIYKNDTPVSFLQILVTLMLLPPALFTGRKLHPFCVNAIRQNWVLFFVGIARKNNYRQDLYLAKCLKDFIVQYVPYFSNNPNQSTHTQPFLKIFSDEFVPDLTKFVLETITTNLLQISSGRLPKPNASNALLILIEIYQNIKYEQHKALTFTLYCLDGILEQIMFLEASESSKKYSVDLFNKIVETMSPYFEQTHVRVIFLKILHILTKKHLSFNSTPLMRLLVYLAQKCPIIIENFIPTLKDEVRNIENIRAVSYDLGLRNMVTKVQNTVTEARSK